MKSVSDLVWLQSDNMPVDMNNELETCQEGPLSV